MLLHMTCGPAAKTAYFSRIISKSQNSVTTTLYRKARQMKSELVELQVPGSHEHSVSGATQVPARQATRGYTFTMAGGAGR